MAATVHDFEVRRIDGTAEPLSRYRGRVLLIVNTASACAFTAQLAGLERLHQVYGAHGFTVLGFPCNQFGAQETGNNADIAAFCTRNYGVSFPMMSKIDVNGPHAHPLYRWLKAQAPGLFRTQAIKWNFTKFLVGPNGQPLRRYAPATKPARLTRAIEAALGPVSN